MSRGGWRDHHGERVQAAIRVGVCNIQPACGNLGIPGDPRAPRVELLEIGSEHDGIEVQWARKRGQPGYRDAHLINLTELHAVDRVRNLGAARGAVSTASSAQECFPITCGLPTSVSVSSCASGDRCRITETRTLYRTTVASIEKSLQPEGSLSSGMTEHSENLYAYPSSSGGVSMISPFCSERQYPAHEHELNEHGVP